MPGPLPRPRRQAHADERFGITRAVSSLMAWLADPARFSPAWISAARVTLAQARAAASRPR